MPAGLIAIKDRLLQLTSQNGLVSNDIQVTSPCVDATVTVGDEDTGTGVRIITIQLKDANGADINYVESVEIGVFSSAARTAFTTTGGSTGLAIGTDGALLALVAKKYFVATSEADGDIDLTYTDSGTDVAYIGVKLPTGRWVMGSQALTNV
jgi:hypothetical protein